MVFASMASRFSRFRFSLVDSSIILFSSGKTLLQISLFPHFHFVIVSDEFTDLASELTLMVEDHPSIHPESAYSVCLGLTIILNAKQYDIGLDL